MLISHRSVDPPPRVFLAVVTLAAGTFPESFRGVFAAAVKAFNESRRVGETQLPGDVWCGHPNGFPALALIATIEFDHPLYGETNAVVLSADQMLSDFVVPALTGNLSATELPLISYYLLSARSVRARAVAV